MATQLNQDVLLKELQDRVDFYIELLDKVPDNRSLLVIKMKPLEEQRNYMIQNYAILTDADLQKADALLKADDGVNVTGSTSIMNIKKGGWFAALAVATGIGYGVYWYLKHRKK